MHKVLRESLPRAGPAIVGGRRARGHDYRVGPLARGNKNFGRSYMMPRSQSAKLVALWIMHGLACARLLRAHGRLEQARNFEAALDELKEILAKELGRDQLTEAMDWASAELWKERGPDMTSILRH